MTTSSVKQRPPLNRIGRLWVPLITVIGGATVLTMAIPRTRYVAAAPALPEMAMQHEVMGPFQRLPMGPFQQIQTVVIPASEYAKVAQTTGNGTSGVAAGPHRLAGHIGATGPILGPLNTAMGPDGPVYGPQWNEKPLPAVTGPLLFQKGQRVANGAPSGPTRRSDISSELPDERKVALSRLVNPQQVQARPAEQAQRADVSAEKPLSIHLAVNAPESGPAAGEVVAVRMSASTDCYAALIRVDTSGQASVVFRSPGPSRSFACAVRGGPGAGAEYLVAVASVHPLNGNDAVAALRSGGGFATVRTAEGGPEPGAAWTQAVAQAGSLSGPTAKWQRFEWAVATGAFAVRSPKQVASARRGTDRGAAVRPTGVKPSPAKAPGNAEGSALPTADKTPKENGDADKSEAPKPAPAGDSKAAPTTPTKGDGGTSQTGAGESAQ